jgi:hypothetical protein
VGAAEAEADEVDGWLSADICAGNGDEDEDEDEDEDDEDVGMVLLILLLCVIVLGDASDGNAATD